MYSPVDNDSKYRCCCGVHVERAAYFIAYVGAILSGISIFYNFLVMNIFGMLNGFISIFLYLSIIHAQKRREPWRYMPYLIISGIGLFFSMLFILFLVGAEVFMPEFFEHFSEEKMRELFPNWNKDTIQKLIRIFVGTYLFIVTLNFVISAWFFSIVYRAYQYLKEEQSSSLPAPNAGIYNPSASLPEQYNAPVPNAPNPSVPYSNPTAPYNNPPPYAGV